MMAAKGYTFTGWDQQVQSAMGTEDLTYTARWSKNKDTAYRVEYYVQDTDGAYKLQHIYNGMETTKATVSLESLKNLVISENQTADSLYTKENTIDEVIASVSGVSLGQVADIPLTNVQYVAGKGTNALTFTATLSKDFEVTPDVNNDIKNLKPVTGTVKDVLGN